MTNQSTAQTDMASSTRSSTGPLLGCVADDVTGATDLATNLTQAGMRVVQILGQPSADQMEIAADVDAVVVALKTRSISSTEAARESCSSLEWLRQLGIRRFYFKYCSTFDSTPQGNIGQVSEAMMAALGCSQTLYCPSFPAAGRTVYQGYLFVHSDLLNESGMQHHPLNPMTDASLPRVLKQQVVHSVGLLAYNEQWDVAEATQGETSIEEELDRLSARQITHIVCDALCDRHLDLLARATAEWPLLTGGSRLAHFVGHNLMQSSNRLVDGSPMTEVAASGQSLILAGSCSAATNRQVNAMAGQADVYVVRVDVEALMHDADQECARLRAEYAAYAERSTVVIASSHDPAAVQLFKARFGDAAVAKSIERLFGRLAQELVDQFPIRQLILAGGETSGAILQQLGVRTLRIGPEICPGVPWTETIGTQPSLALALKSGNFGNDDFFLNALEKLS